MAAVGVAAMLFAGYVLDDITLTVASQFGAFIAIAYIVSRGIAKAGARRGFEPEWRGTGYGYYAGSRAAEDEWSERRSAAVNPTVNPTVGDTRVER